MAIFTILEPPDANPDRVVLVREGFHGRAFLLTVLWALWHRLWVIAALLFVVYLALGFAGEWFQWHWAVRSASEFGLALLFGLEAADLRIRALRRAGYRRAGLIQATNLEAAELDYFAGRRIIRPSAPAPEYRPQPAHHDTLGLFGSR